MRLISGSLESCTLCVDGRASHPSQIGDATRVLADDGIILEIGKQLRTWNAVDTGVFNMTPDVFPVIEGLMLRQQLDVGISDIVTYMAANGQPFMACDVSGMFWADVDTAEDYESVNTLLTGAAWTDVYDGIVSRHLNRRLSPARSTSVRPYARHAESGVGGEPGSGSRGRFCVSRTAIPSPPPCWPRLLRSWTAWTATWRGSRA